MTEQSEIEAVAAGETREFVTVHIGQQLFGIPVEQVADVFAPQSMTSVPLASAEIAGVLNLRGRIVTAVDMRQRLGVESSEEDGHCMAIHIERKGESYGLIVDRVGDVMRLKEAEFEPSPANLDQRWRSVSTGVQRLEEELMVILDVDRVLGFGVEEAAA